MKQKGEGSTSQADETESHGVERERNPNRGGEERDYYQKGYRGRGRGGRGRGGYERGGNPKYNSGEYHESGSGGEFYQKKQYQAKEDRDGAEKRMVKKVKAPAFKKETEVKSSTKPKRSGNRFAEFENM